MLLSDKICIITGAASARGIGRATARIFAEQGGTVVILDLKEADAKAAARDIGEKPMGSKHLGLACDVTDKAACLKAVSQVTAEFGRVDVLINNAGISQPLKIMDIEPKNYDAVLDVNLRGTLYMSQAAIPHMRRRSKAPSCACPRCRPSAAAASSAGRITAPPRAACSASPRPWRASSAPTISASTR